MNYLQKKSNVKIGTQTHDGQTDMKRPRQQTAIAAAVVHKITNDVVCWASDVRHTRTPHQICENNTPVNGISTWWRNEGRKRGRIKILFKWREKKKTVQSVLATMVAATTAPEQQQRRRRRRRRWRRRRQRQTISINNVGGRRLVLYGTCDFS